MSWSQSHLITDLRERIGGLTESDLPDQGISPEVAALLERVAVAIDELQHRNDQLETRASEIEIERRRYRALFEGVPDGYVITDNAGVISEVNLTAARLLGRSRRHLIGRPLASFMAEADQSAFFTQLARADARRSALASTVAIIAQDEPFQVELHGVVERHGLDGGGYTIRWLLRDRRHDPVTAQLRANEEQLRALFQTAPIAIVLYDGAGDILFANDCARDLLGPGPDALAITDWLASVHPEDRAGVSDAIACSLADGSAAHVTHRLLHPDGTIRWIDHDITEVLGGAGQVEGFVSTLFDLTPERQATQRLEQSIGFTDAILDTVGAIIVVLDGDGRLVRWNSAFEQVTGLGAQELAAKPTFVELLAPEGRELFTAELALLIAEQRPRLSEAEILTTAGGRRRISWTNTVLSAADGSVRVVIGTGLDVTEQHELEERLAQRDRLESLGRVAAGLSHDFNNTLTVLQARIGRISDRHDDEATTEDVAAIDRTIARTGRLISELLSFSGTGGGFHELMEVNVEIERMTSLTADLMGTGIDVVLDLTAQDTTIAMDPSRFDQVITNLALNAMDAMPAGGTLTVTTIVETIGAGRDQQRWSAHLASGRYVRITVTDTGVGIEPGLVSKVFDPYVTTKPPSRGTGLGLATTYGTIIAAGGDIVLESKVGQGTSITMWLPRSADTATTGQAAADLASRWLPCGWT